MPNSGYYGTFGLRHLTGILSSSCLSHRPVTMRSRLHIGSLNRHKYMLVAAILLILILYLSLPPPQSKLDIRTEVTHGQNHPRYLHQSTFRVDPDREYETKLSKALRDIEIAGNQRHDEDATDTIWQIILSTKDHRKDDSYEFQKQNAEWKYQVCI
jgi:hypothetical protein